MIAVMMHLVTEMMQTSPLGCLHHLSVTFSHNIWI